MRLHLIDGTFELFRAYYSQRPEHIDPEGRDRKATVGVAASLIALAKQESVTHIAVAFDNPIESWRNEIFDGYKTGFGIEPVLRDQFDPVEEAVAALGMVVWALPEFEADDMMATGCARWRDQVEQVRLMTPDKDLGQMLDGTHVVQYDRIRRKEIDEAALRERRGIAPKSIPDYLALVGDTADGIPGLPKFGEKTAASLLGRWPHLEDIPRDAAQWTGVRGAAKLADTFSERYEDALLYRRLATLVVDAPLPEESLDELAFKGIPKDRFSEWCTALGAEDLLGRAFPALPAL